MELISRLIIGKKSKNPEKRDIIWNMAGSFLYAFASMVLSIAVVQIAGEDAGGIFTFAFTTFGQHMFMMAYFGIRPFQITDTGGKYSFGDYLGLRLLTCGAAVLTGMGYVFLNGYSFEKAAVVFLMVVYKVIDALADAYEAEFQRGGRLYLMENPTPSGRSFPWAYSWLPWRIRKIWPPPACGLWEPRRRGSWCSTCW